MINSSDIGLNSLLKITNVATVTRFSDRMVRLQNIRESKIEVTIKEEPLEIHWKGKNICLNYIKFQWNIEFRYGAQNDSFKNTFSKPG